MAYLRPEQGGKPMTGRVIGFALLGMILGAVAGGILGFIGGFAWTAIARTSAFEGYAGYVTAMWMLAGIIIGFIYGGVRGARHGRKG